MKANIGNTDRTVRIVAGVVIIAAGFYFKSWLGVIGVIPILTATVRWCPLYAPLGITTKKDD